EEREEGDRKKASSTPAVLEVTGKLQLASPSAGGTVAYDPKTGKELWKVNHLGMNAASPPVMGNGLVYVTIGHRAKVLAIRPTGTGDVSRTHVAWALNRGPTRPAPLLLGELLFFVNDQGIATCVEAKSGKPVWTRRIT